MFGGTWAMIAICANCSCSRGRRASSLAALQVEYRDADTTIPTKAPAWVSLRPTSCPRQYRFSNVPTPADGAGGMIYGVISSGKE
jgi:hypothetical protein